MASNQRAYVAQMLGEGLPEAEIARRAGISRQMVNRWKHLLAKQGKEIFLQPKVHDHHYIGLTRKQIHCAALERIEHYSHPAPHGLDTIYTLLREAWGSVARRNCTSGGNRDLQARND